MKKSIVCLFLGILMLLPFSLTGCGNSGATDTSQDKAARAYTTLSFWNSSTTVEPPNSKRPFSSPRTKRCGPW